MPVRGIRQETPNTKTKTKLYFLSTEKDDPEGTDYSYVCIR